MKFGWKRTLAVCALVLSVSPLVAADGAMPRAEWHARVGACAQNAQTLRETMQKVAPADQTALLGEVNAAIARMPGSDEVKGARFYAANSAAVRSAAKGNLANVLAEVFATVPPEFLTDINERFAKEVFRRSGSQNRAFTDAQYTALATNAMAVINARCERAENAGVRETFAVCMFVRASEGSPADLKDVLIATMPNADNRASAANEWIGPALGIGQEQTYDPMLGQAGAGEEPDHAVVTTLTGAHDVMVGLLGDLAAEGSGMATSAANLGAGAGLRAGVLGAAPGMDDFSGIDRVPRAYVGSKTAVGGDKDGPASGDNPYYRPKRDDHGGDHGGGYPGQGF